MRAMILAAGLGERMRPLTDDTPKPLLQAGERSLIEHQVAALAAAGIRELVINHFYLGEQIEERLGDGERFGLDINYSREAERLDTGGGIAKALPLLGESFIVVNADIWTDFDYGRLSPVDGATCLAHLVLVDNTEHNPGGDFALRDDGRLRQDAGQSGRLTFAGISVLHRQLFAGQSVQPFSMVPLLRQAMDRGLVRGEYHGGEWRDIGTPARLEALRSHLESREACH